MYLLNSSGVVREIGSPSRAYELNCKGIFLILICKSQDFAGENRRILRVIPLPTVHLFRPLSAQTSVPISPARVLGFTTREATQQYSTCMRNSPHLRGYSRFESSSCIGYLDHPFKNKHIEREKVEFTRFCGDPKQSG